MCVGDLLLLVVHGAHVIWLEVKQPLKNMSWD